MRENKSQSAQQQQELKHLTLAPTPPASVPLMSSSDLDIPVKTETMEQQQQSRDDQRNLEDYLCAFSQEDLAGVSEMMEEVEQQVYPCSSPMQARATQDQIPASAVQANATWAAHQVEAEREDDQIRSLERMRAISCNTSPLPHVKDPTPPQTSVGKLHLMKSLTNIRRQLLDLEMDLNNYLEST